MASGHPTRHGPDVQWWERHSRRHVELFSTGLRTHIFSSFPSEGSQDLAICFSICFFETCRA